MSPRFDHARHSLAEQLADYNERIASFGEDAHTITDIQRGIGGLLADNACSENEIMAVLKERRDAGSISDDTFDIVRTVLYELISEGVPTTPKMAAMTAVADVPENEPANRAEPRLVDTTENDPYAKTMVIDEASEATLAAEKQVQVGTVLRDRFLLQERVSGGSMGVVFKALDRRLAEAGSEDPVVAIKVLSPQLARNGHALRALQQEAAKGRCLVHRNIVRFIDLDRDDELYFIVMEWLEGRNLAEILDDPTSKQFPVDQAIDIVKQIASALAYAHSCGIVHADVKPGNIMVMPDGSIKLFDFGIARVRQTQREASTSSFNPTMLGAVTPAYSSMQVLTGEDPVAVDDIYSLGCLMYRLIAGYRVFGPRNAAEAAQEGMQPQPLKELSDVQWKVLKKALSYARITRFRSMEEFLEALEQTPSEPITVTVEPKYDIEERSGTGKWVLAALLLLSLLGFFADREGYLDGVKADIMNSEFVRGLRTPEAAPPLAAPSVAETATDDQAQVIEPLPDSVEQVEVPAETDADAAVEASEVEASEVDATSDAVAEEIIAGSDAQNNEAELIDYSAYPPATLQIPVSLRGGNAETYTLTLQEGGDAATIEFERLSAAYPLTLRLEEIAYSGNRSPWARGQFNMSNEGFVEFPAGQRHGRIQLSMAEDTLREADQQSTLRVRDVDSAESELAVVTVFLRDDDQRSFEAQLPANTVAFAMGQASVRESDPAVQLDIQRFNPDSSTMVVGYRIESITATMDQDYFAPAFQEITFGPEQRSARLLIPLVQDEEVEGDEAFVVELSNQQTATGMDLYQRIVVMIRDDD